MKYESLLVCNKMFKLDTSYQLNAFKDRNNLIKALLVNRFKRLSWIIFPTPRINKKIGKIIKPI